MALGGLALASAAWGLTVDFGPEEPFGPAAYHKVRPGMSRDEVRETVGLRPGRYSISISSMRGYDILKEWDHAPDRPDVRLREWWSGDRYVLAVTYGPDGTVVGARVGEFITQPRVTFLDRLRSWLADARARLGV